MKDITIHPRATIKEAMENLGKEVNDINKLSTELRNTMRKILTE